MLAVSSTASVTVEDARAAASAAVVPLFAVARAFWYSAAASPGCEGCGACDGCRNDKCGCHRVPGVDATRDLQQNDRGPPRDRRRQDRCGFAGRNRSTTTA
jgi:hypothetical protein